jgi:hypothetical protein
MISIDLYFNKQAYTYFGWNTEKSGLDSFVMDCIKVNIIVIPDSLERHTPF